MSDQNLITIEGDGRITIREGANGHVTLHLYNAAQIPGQLRELSEAQIDSLLQIAEEQPTLPDLFKVLLNGIAKEKNIAKGNVSHVSGNVEIGDKITYNYLPRVSEFELYQNAVKKYNHNQHRLTVEPIEEVDFSDLDEQVVELFMKRERVVQHLTINNPRSNSIAHRLEKLGLMVDGKRMLKGVCLSLGSDHKIRNLSSIATPSKFVVYNDQEATRVKIIEHLNGNLLAQYEQSNDLLIKHLTLIRDIASDLDDYEIPKIVFRELIANAFIHSDYSHKTHAVNIKIELFPDRLVITNPGFFPDIIDPNNPETIHNSITLNPDVAKVFFLYGIVETVGKGIARIQHVLQKKGFEKPVFEQVNGSVKITVFKKPLGANLPDKAGAYYPKELTLQVPKTFPEDIVGRDEDLAKVYDLLSIHNRRVLINGIGGIGKTTLAQAYISQYYNHYRHIVWITHSAGGIEKDFVNAPGLIKNLDVKTTDTSTEKLFEEIIRKLKALDNGPSLLIIDNADASITAYLNLLPALPYWHLLATSREEILGFHLQPLNFLDEAQTIILFKKYYLHGKLNDQDIEELVRMVDYHTLTVEILAKTAAVQRYSAAMLKHAIDKNLKANIAIRHNEGAVNITGVGSYLRTVFNLSRLNEYEIWLMKQFACLPAGFHTYELLEEIIITKDTEYADSFPETLVSIARKGWLLQHKETDSYKIHPILAELVKQDHSIGIQDIASLMDNISRKLNISNAKGNIVDKFVWISFGQALLANFKGNMHVELAKLQHNLAVVLRTFGDYQGAKNLMELAVRTAEEQLGEDHPTTASRYSNLALLLQDLKDYKGAQLLLQKVMHSVTEEQGKGHPATSVSYSNLALVLLVLGDNAGARSLLEEIVRFNEERFGAEHPVTAASYSNLALSLEIAGDYSAAKALLEKALHAAKIHFGEEHPSTAARYANLALVLKTIGDYGGAKLLLEKALQSDRKHFGEEHPTTATRLRNLADVLFGLGDYKKALQLSETAIAIFKTLYQKGIPLSPMELMFISQ